MLRDPARRGFTLVESIAVIAIMTILFVLVAPALSSIRNANSVNEAVSGISLSLNQARAYAMAHNTYVWVGFTSSPTTPTTLLVGIVAGTTGNPSDLTSNYLLPVGKAQSYSNLTLTTAAMAEAANTHANWSAALTGAADSTELSSSNLTSFSENSGGESINFSQHKNLQFDPQGEASISSNAADLLPHWIQLGLQPQRGGSITNPNVAIIQVAGLSGQVQVFRP